MHNNAKQPVQLKFRQIEIFQFLASDKLHYFCNILSFQTVQNWIIPLTLKLRRIILEIVQISHGMFVNTTIFRRNSHIDDI